MNSECSSGCESGWTHYLDQSSVSATQCQRAIAGGINVDEDYRRKGGKEDENEEEEEEDLSMVSDASSGPPHFQEDEYENEFSCSASQSAKKSEKKMKMKNHGFEQQRSYLDDTASSPVLSFSKKSLPLSKNQGPVDHVLNFSQGGFSATHFKCSCEFLQGKSAFQNHLGFFQSSIHGKPPSKESGGFKKSGN